MSFARAPPHLRSLSSDCNRYASYAACYGLCSRIISSLWLAGRYSRSISLPSQTTRLFNISAYTIKEDRVLPGSNQYGNWRAGILKRNRQRFNQTFQFEAPSQRARRLKHQQDPKVERDIRRIIGANGFGAKLNATWRALKEEDFTWEQVCFGVFTTIIVCHSVVDVYRVCRFNRKEEKGPSRVRHW